MKLVKRNILLNPGPATTSDTVKNAMVVPSLIRRALECEDTLEVWGDGSQIRDFIYCDDVARAMMLVVEKQISQPINLDSGHGIKIRDLVETIIKNIPDKKLTIKWDQSKPVGDKIRIMNTNLSKKIGFHCKTTLDEGIRATIKWYLQNKKYSSNKYNSFNAKLEKPTSFDGMVEKLAKASNTFRAEKSDEVKDKTN